ncbi:MAG: sulfatase-like hydrolase/transferase [Verrucomicrobiales bacterium]|nr:sulfatase-like hydrolase/transferase [Verrucomicrobiales bacterium]
MKNFTTVIHAILLCTISAVCTESAHCQSSEGKRPNIVLILLDDLGYADVGFNAELFGVKTDVVTPKIDDLARKGTIFKQAYVAHPFCGPSRMALLSGRMPHCYGGQKNLSDIAKNLHDYNEKGLPLSETLISTVLQRSGYSTACFGKWHIGSSKPFHPNNRGFNEFFGFLGGGHQYYPSATDKVEPKINDYQYFLERNGKETRSPEGAYLTDMLSVEGSNYIATKAKQDQPFFLYMSYNAPHSPLQGKTEDLAFLYPDHMPENPKNGIDYRDYEGRQNYVAMMYAVDRGIDRIITTLRDPDSDGDNSDSIEANTLVVFLSDNGGKIAQAANNDPLQDDKGSTMEGGIRVPMFMYWPGKIPSGAVYDHPVLALDFYPTFASLANAEIPNDKILDGKDIWQDFLAGKNPHADDTMFWLRHHGGINETAIRRGNVKAYRKGFSHWKAFDVVNDVAESENIANQNEEILKSMIEAGLEWSKTHKDPQWHDTQNGLDSWTKNQMPKYPETFTFR